MAAKSSRAKRTFSPQAADQSVGSGQGTASTFYGRLAFPLLIAILSIATFYAPSLLFTAVYAPRKGVCGDGVCGFGETETTCSRDCNIHVCGDGFCSQKETCIVDERFPGRLLRDDRSPCLLDCGRCWETDTDDKLVSPLDRRSEYLSRKRWGTYRPRHYFGVKERHEKPLAFGVGWGKDSQRLRFLCGDGVRNYGWERHNGYDYGEHVANDTELGVLMRKHFVGFGENKWAVRIEGSAIATPNGTLIGEEKGKVVSVYLHFSKEGGDGTLLRPDIQSPTSAETTTTALENGLVTLSGSNHGRKFTAAVRVAGGMGKQKEVKKTLTRGPTVLTATEKTANRFYEVKPIVEDATRRMAGAPTKGQQGALLRSPPSRESDNVVILELRLRSPFTVDVVFSEEGNNSEDIDTVSMKYLSSVILARRSAFDSHFLERILQKPIQAQAGKNTGQGIMDLELRTARYALSNHIGSMVYSVGSITYEEDPESPVTQLPAHRRRQGESVPLLRTSSKALFSGVPSRSFFPRGFLWDEGFHLLLSCRWDTLLCVDSLSHWMKWVTPSGWIPREMFVGEESKLGVEQKWWTQYEAHANPPSLFLALDYLLARLEAFDVNGRNINGGTDPSTDGEMEAVREFFEWSFSRLLRWVTWLKRTQSSQHRFVFRWRGRSFGDGLWHTLASGLDDYPRGTDPSRFNDELHVDLTAWMHFSSSVLRRIAIALKNVAISRQVTSSKSSVESDLERAGFPSINSFESYCLAFEQNVSAHIGAVFFNGGLELHTDVGVLSKTEVARTLATAQQKKLPFVAQQLETLRLRGWEKGVVTQLPHIGYVSLFPFLLDSLSAKTVDDQRHRSHVIDGVLYAIQSETVLGSRAGVRSLALRDLFYGTAENYWRGPVWMNLNYLTLRALYKEAHRDEMGQTREVSEEVSFHVSKATKAGKAYHELRSKLISAVTSSFERTGFVFEQYNDMTTAGQRVGPFTGWTALIALIIGDDY